MSISERQKTNKAGQDLIFVTGATGNVGRQVVLQLVDAGYRVRALSRNPDAAGLPREVVVVRGDLSDPSTLDANLAGIDAFFLVWRLPTPDAAPALVERVAHRARRMVFLSSIAVRDDAENETNHLARFHRDVENAIERSGLEWTFLRPGWFATNSLMWWAPQIRSGDTVRWPYAAAELAPIHERDIAAVAVRALTEAGHNRRKYVLTGPESLTFVEQVRTIGEAIGRALHYDEISPEAAREQLLSYMPPVIVDVLLKAWAGTVYQPSAITETVAEVTGNRARSFREWASDHASDFRLEQSGSARAGA